MTPKEDSDKQQLTSVAKAFAMITHLEQRGPKTMSEMAEDFDIPASTAHIYLSTLLNTGYVVKKDRRYRCSLQFLRTGGLIRDKLPLFQASKQEVDNLQKELGEYSNVGTIENMYMVQLYKSENPDSIDDEAELGSHLYLHSTATGKAMLSQLPDTIVDEVIRNRGLPQQTSATITDRDDLFDNLSTVQQRGYSINREEDHPGVCAVAVPIMDNDDTVLGAISVSGPTSRMDSDRIETQISQALFDKRNVIELKIQRYRRS